MEQEKLTWKFYEKAAEEVENENIKKLFNELAKIEKTHYELLKVQHHSVMNTGMWIDRKDFNLEGD